MMTTMQWYGCGMGVALLALVVMMVVGLDRMYALGYRHGRHFQKRADDAEYEADLRRISEELKAAVLSK